MPIPPPSSPNLAHAFLFVKIRSPCYPGRMLGVTKTRLGEANWEGMGQTRFFALGVSATP
jgi:hypothetical protein